ncbi:hypothetical protein DC28_15285 [Spirochaeta lutea]|uniref:Uncharacterized protein n=1 Tax=Spirochaeta lutea TaxID=1480694 RepID=A0A098QWK9_9SPIO|nr:hypothetical protein DC28_15285 [Spirochaeta lutea]
MHRWANLVRLGCMESPDSDLKGRPGVMRPRETGTTSAGSVRSPKQARLTEGVLEPTMESPG